MAEYATSMTTCDKGKLGDVKRDLHHKVHPFLQVGAQSHDYGVLGNQRFHSLSLTLSQSSNEAAVT